jgi:hypothetical protein
MLQEVFNGVHESKEIKKRLGLYSCKFQLRVSVYNEVWRYHRFVVRNKNIVNSGVGDKKSTARKLIQHNKTPSHVSCSAYVCGKTEGCKVTREISCVSEG